EPHTEKAPFVAPFSYALPQGRMSAGSEGVGQLDEVGDVELLGTHGRVDSGGSDACLRVGAKRLQTGAQHLAALAEGRGGEALQRLKIAVERRLARCQVDDGRRDFRW